MINWKRAKKYWLRVYQSKRYGSPEKVQEAKSFVQKYASKIRWAKTICELGVGDGKHLHFFLEKYPNKKYCGNDFNPKVCSLVEKSYPDVFKKCDIMNKSTDKYLKGCLQYVDVIFTYNHLMYVPEEGIDRICSKISHVTGKYLLFREIYTPIKYNDLDKKSFLSFGFGRDYQKKFCEFELKNRYVETINISNKYVEFHTYFFKRIG